MRIEKFPMAQEGEKGGSFMKKAQVVGTSSIIMMEKGGSFKKNNQRICFEYHLEVTTFMERFQTHVES